MHYLVNTSDQISILIYNSMLTSNSVSLEFKILKKDLNQ